MPRPDDGGPAFPRPISEDRTSGDLFDGNDMVPAQNGMSLRDWFAGQALAGYLASYGVEGAGHADPDKAAGWAFRYADEMLKARTAK